MKLHRYTVPVHHAKVVLGEDGFFAATSDVGAYAYQLPGDARAFFRTHVDAEKHVDMLCRANGAKAELFDADRTAKKIAELFYRPALEYTKATAIANGSRTDAEVRQTVDHWVTLASESWENEGDVWAWIACLRGQNVDPDDEWLASILRGWIEDDDVIAGCIVVAPNEPLQRFCREVLPALRTMLEAEERVRERVTEDLTDALDDESVVAGHRMERSLVDFRRGCIVTLQAEQAKVDPDGSLIALLCDAVRLTRERS